MKDRYIYPAIIKKENDDYLINFPDIENCFTFGNSMEDALNSAKEVLQLVLYEFEENNVEIPEPSNIQDISNENNDFMVLIDIWMIPFRDQMENTSVKKTLTIPKWLDDMAKKENINFSQVLQAAIKNELNIKNMNK